MPAIRLHTAFAIFDLVAFIGLLCFSKGFREIDAPFMADVSLLAALAVLAIFAWECRIISRGGCDE